MSAANVMRPIYMKSNVNTKASGSAYIEHERTKVMCSVYGPRTATGRGEFSETGRVVCDVRFAPFATRVRRERTQTSQEKEMSSALRAALEPAIQLDRFPKSVVEVFVVILESDGGECAMADREVSREGRDGG
jgi:exosome complex component MTR3